MNKAKPLTRSDVTVHSKQLGGFIGETWHIEVGGKYYVVSAASIPREGAETSVFPADHAGVVSTLREVASVEGLDHEAAIADLLRRLNDNTVGSGQR